MRSEYDTSEAFWFESRERGVISEVMYVNYIQVNYRTMLDHLLTVQHTFKAL